MRLPAVSTSFLTCLVLLPWQAKGQPQPPFAPPSWFSESTGLDTRDVALGDVDRDGDLDVVFGNYRTSTLHLNEGGTFGSPVWFSPSQATTNIALGDMDGDGDLDLVCANYAWRITLFVSEGGTFGSAPVWSSPSPKTWSIALGDVDGDGDLDIVCGNAGAPTGVYLNEGAGVFSSPVLSGGSELTASIALGDVDGDGDLDLVRGNSQAPALTLYLNDGGAFGAEPVWSLQQAPEGLLVALGDVDGDGGLDLVVGDSEDRTKLFANIGGSFGTDPVWESPVPEGAWAVTLGDVDGDGDLDLLVGSSNYEPTRLYVNTAGTFGTAPAWTASQNEWTKSLALGDVDGDGDLDLVAANDGRSTLSLNTGGFRLFARDPVRTGPPDPTLDAALGDVDGDGRADLVCGNFGTRTNLYLGTDGGFASTPIWNSGSDFTTTSLALGDVNGDGKLDLVCGNRDHRSTLYLNSEGAFGAVPAWWSAQFERTHAVALGDVDGDGDLDLVCGNFEQSTTLYVNVGGSFDAAPAWRTARTDPTLDVALGDVDGDGDLDLVCGNHGHSTLYRNHGTGLDSIPIWISGPTADVSSVALGDVDGDGDLDLVCGNEGGGNPFHYYRNSGGTLDATPLSWGPNANVKDIALADADGDGDLDLVGGYDVYFSPLYLNAGDAFETNWAWGTPDTNDLTQAVHLGDVDGDGDVDLVCGNYGQPTAIYHGLTNPPVRGDLANPRNHLPNNDAFVRFSTVLAMDGNLRLVRLTAVDVESDPVWIVPQWRYKDLPHWNPVEVRSTGTPLGPFTSSPEGVVHEFLWDTSRMPVDQRPIILSLRAVSQPRRTGVVQRIVQYEKDVGPIPVRRPMIAVSSLALEMHGVTVGDTVVASFQISNRGNEPLIIHEISTPSPALWVDRVAPFGIGPAGRIDLALSFAPMSGDTADSLWIVSNDPAGPRLALPLVTDVRDLNFVARLLAPQAEVPIGQALTAVLTPGAGVHIERAAIRYRKLGTAGIFSMSILHPLAGDFVGTIPNSGVTEGGIEYFFEVENSGVVKTAPDTGTFTQAVMAPERIIARVLQTASVGFLAGRSITVEVQLPEGADFVGGVLHFRRGGEQAYQLAPFTDGDPFPMARIPEGFVTARGVEFWVEAQTSTRSLTDPQSDAAVAPRTVQVLVQGIEESGLHPGGRFRLVSVPLVFGSERTFDALVSDESEFGVYDPVRWRLFRYVPGAHVNEELDPNSAWFHVAPGRAFWLVTRQPHRVDTAPVDALSTPTGAPCPIVLAPGWHQFGNPFAFPVAWEAVGASSAVTSLVGFDPTLGTIGDFSEPAPAVLEPFEGYFVHNSSSEPETLWVPPLAALPAAAKAVTEAMSMDSWSARLQAKTREAVDGANSFGVDARASDGHDRLDGLEPPHVPGPWIQVAFAPREGDSRSDLYRRDLRATGHEGEVWEIELRSQSAAAPVTLELRTDSQLPPALGIRLVDREQQVSVDLLQPGGEPGSYSLVSYGPNRPYRLALLAGSAGFLEREEATSAEIPAHVVLEHGPNPFSAAARIRFGLPQAQRATLAIYNVRGQRVALLRQDELVPAGYHVSIWNGTDAAGRPLPSGVYFCRLETGATQLTRRFVLLR